MTRAHKIVNLIGVPLPLVGLIAAIVLLWNRAIGPLELGLLVGLYVLTALGVTLGYHRMFTHRAFESSRAFRAIVAVLGSMAMQGSVITWVADHRKHHTFTDQEGDPHSPHLSGPGFWGGVKGLWHAHVGWLFETVGTAERERFAPDLLKDRVLRVVDKLFFVWVVLGFAIPFALGWVVGGGLGSGADRAALGRVRARVPAPPRHVVDQLGLPFLRSPPVRRRGRVAQRVLARAAVDGRGVAPQPPRVPDLRVSRPALWERVADPTGLLIALLEKLGIVWNVVRVSPERQRAKSLPRRPAPARTVADPVPASRLERRHRQAGAVQLLPVPSASSRGPLQTIAQPLLWMRSASR